MANAARLSGDHQVAVYLEVGEERARVFVRDRGIGFEPGAVPPDRKGLSESIVGRMHRYGGTATIHTAVGEGTEIELEVPRPAAVGAPVGEHSTS
jgi:signal transduction histidine kinase